MEGAENNDRDQSLKERKRSSEIRRKKEGRKRRWRRGRGRRRNTFSFPVFFTCYHSNEIVVFSPRREQNIVVLVETIVKNMKCVCETVTVISQIVI
jgi:hypothetical protein